jgi:hypothetical protein
MNAVQDPGFAPYAILPEPELEFGQARAGAARATDPQRGLELYGPYSTRLGGKWHPSATTIIPLASREDWESVVGALRRLGEFQRIEEPTPAARIDYPGYESAFRSQFLLDVPSTPGPRLIDPDAFAQALAAPSAADGYRRVLACIEQALEALLPLSESSVVALYLPRAVIERFRRFTPDFRPLDDGSGAGRRPARRVMLEELLVEEKEPESTLFHDLRRSIKVLFMRRGVACQILTDNFLGDDPGVPWAGKLWNMGTSIFCKAGGIPWRVVTDENVAYCGIRFGVSRDRGGQSILVGLAQVFNAAGELVALRAGQAMKRKSRSESGYYLSQEQARVLLSDAIGDYQEVTGRLPNRIVIHKSSPFKTGESQGLEEASAGIRELDLVFLKKGAGLRLIPDRGQPADRGTVVPTSDNSALVYTTGYEDETGKWRGKHVPRPFELVRYKSARSLMDNARDVLRMTKMNWNTTLYYRREPCTFTNATEVIGMMKELGDDDVLKPSIRYYI